ncbi:MAG: aquaporin family protein [Synergistaceae bacterium]|jgi:glycerol uptake facilitator protein|nr:aquaporin family protein [Synergistaceae bacterium]
MDKALIGEFLGTVVLVWLGDSIGANLTLPQAKGSGSGASAWVTVNMGWCFSLMMAIYAGWFFGSAQADFNPAVSLFKFLSGVEGYTLPRVIVLSIVQIAGGVVGGIGVYITFAGYWDAPISGEAKLGIFATGTAVRNIPVNILQEAIETIFLIMGIQFLVRAIGGDATNTYLLPFMIGGLLYAIGAGMGGTTGYAMNIARDLGPRIAYAILPIPGKCAPDWGYSIVPIAGSLIGGVVSYALCSALG